MRFTTATIALVASLLAANASPLAEEPERIGKRCTGTISSLADVATAQTCTTININAFTVTAGQTFLLTPPSNSVVNLLGTVTFGVANWDGPLFKLSGTNITFNGNSHTFDGQGAKYWDGQGLNGGVTKPSKLAQFTNTGNVNNLIIKNTPARAISLGNSKASLTLDKITVDNSAGDAGALGHNTDCFDISATGGTTVQNSICKNQDDCLAINRGSDITFKNNQCSGGHGISVGSIDADITVSNIIISGNTVTSSTNGLRIKTKAAATGSTVTGVTYTDNKLSGITDYGVIIDQSYPDTNGTPGTGVIVSGVKFSGTNTVAVGSSATRVLINCGSTTSCSGTWDLSGLSVTGGKASSIKNVKVSGGTY